MLVFDEVSAAFELIGNSECGLEDVEGVRQVIELNIRDFEE
jgi:hypothetical protein